MPPDFSSTRMTMRDHDPGDECEPEGCPGPICPADQTVGCLGCGRFWWGAECDLFCVTHPGHWEEPFDEDEMLQWTSAPGRNRIALDVPYLQHESAIALKDKYQCEKT